jgi:succinate dehydrogenase (ubiquinone) cytochrome b560 subunit
LAGVDVPALMSTIGDVTLIGQVAKFGVAFPLTFHYLGGIRHFMWDKNPESLDNEKVEASSKILFGAATAVSAAIALL